MTDFSKPSLASVLRLGDQPGRVGQGAASVRVFARKHRHASSVGVGNPGSTRDGQPGKGPLADGPRLRPQLARRRHLPAAHRREQREFSEGILLS